jgi:hypothetical protein
MDRALSKCMRLESLTFVYRYDPAVWLGLSQLHTLRGVDLSLAPASAIAAALPRLHTLDASIGVADAAAVRGFFELLVPRLRVLSFASFASVSVWSEGQNAEPTEGPPPALPMLQDLSWHGVIPVEVTSRFMGARPLELSTSRDVIADWLAAADETTTAGREAPCAPLLQVRSLAIRSGALSPSDLARVLRTAPQLRRLAAHSVRVGADGDSFWFSNTSGRTRSALCGLTHPRLRIVEVYNFGDSDTEESDEEGAEFVPPVDCALRLRRDHFPRLQRLIFTDPYHKEHRFDATLQE